MCRIANKDRDSRILGYVETVSDERQKALDARLRTLGYYNPRRNVTMDANLRVIARGRVLSALVYDAG
jgi:hypothetical protein